MPPVPRTEYEKELVGTIGTYGWQITSVFDPKRKDPPFTYSVGINESLNKPDVIIIGIHPQTAKNIINLYGDGLRIDAEKYQRGGVYSDLLPGFGVCFIDANDDAKTNYTLSCKWYYGGIGFDLIQCVWQSEDHIWPWDDEADDQLKFDQPLFGEKPKVLR